jgi:hypothetical protein
MSVANGSRHFGVPAGEYDVEFTGVEEKHLPTQGDFGGSRKYVWKFVVASGPCAGKVIEQITGTEMNSPKNKLWSLCSMFLGRPVRPGDEIEPGKWVRCRYLLSWTVNPASTSEPKRCHVSGLTPRAATSGAKAGGDGKATPGRQGAPSAPTDPGPWDDPLPLAAVPAPAPFPTSLLPGAAANFVREVSTAAHCPEDYAGVAALVLAGASVGASRALEVKPGWTERPGLYAAIVAPPGAAKSPVIRAAAAPVYREQARLHEAYRQAAKDYRDGNLETKPSEPTVCVSDCTTEKLADVLHDNPRGVAMVRDELTALVAGMNQYKAGGKGADKQFYLSAWAGEPVIVHRKAQQAGSVFVQHPFLAVLGGLPPDLLDRLRGDRNVCDGWMDRILFTYPDPPRAAGEDWRCVRGETAAAWDRMLSDLRGLETVKDDHHGERPLFLCLTADGKRAWEALTGRLADEVNAEDFPPHLRGPWSKFRGYGARLALIVQMMRLSARETQDDDVDGESVGRADRLVAYFQSHARKVYACIDADPRLADAQRVLRWLPKFCESVNCVNGPKRVSKRDIHANVLGGRRTIEEVDQVVALLLRYGYLRLAAQKDRGGPGRKPSPEYEVHPQVSRY